MPQVSMGTWQRTLLLLLSEIAHATSDPDPPKIIKWTIVKCGPGRTLPARDNGERVASEELTTTKAIFIMSQCDVEYKTLIGIKKFIIMALSQKQHKWNKKKNQG